VVTIRTITANARNHREPKCEVIWFWFRCHETASVHSSQIGGVRSPASFARITDWRKPWTVVPPLRLPLCSSGRGLVLGSSALAQQKSVKDQLVGSWIFVSSTTKAEDGSPFWGANPKGLVIFTANGRYSTHLMRSDRPKFSANSRTKGTPEENKAAVLGNISSFGTYTVDEDKKTFTIRFEGSTYPNLEGTVQARPFEIVGDELRVTNPAPTAGGPPSHIVYRRDK
jgi:hypothetical protein